VAGQIGLEPTLAEYIVTMVDVFRGVRRVLADDGTLWLNIGDSYASSGVGGAMSDKSSLQNGKGINPKHKAVSFGRAPTPAGMKPKDLMMVPARLAIALQDDGWYLRSDIIWAKPNPMPESVRDRPTSAHEHIFLLTKQARYFYDADAVAEPLAEANAQRTTDHYNTAERYGAGNGGNGGLDSLAVRMRDGNHTTRNQRNVWTITTHGFPEAHFATFPTEIPRRCIKAGSREGDTILDPFLGSGTTLLVADELGRNGIGIELNPEYAAMAERRITGACPMFAEVGVA